MYQQRENWQLKSLQAGTDRTGKEESQKTQSEITTSESAVKKQEELKK